MGILLMPSTRKVGIYIHVEVGVGGGSKQETFVLGGEQVAANPLNSLLMKVSGVDGKTCAVVSCHANIRSCHLGQVAELANDQPVVPGLGADKATMIRVQHCDGGSGFRVTRLET